MAQRFAEDVPYAQMDRRRIPDHEWWILRMVLYVVMVLSLAGIVLLDRPTACICFVVSLAGLACAAKKHPLDDD